MLACGQVADFRKSSGAQARCGLCFASAARPRQLTIAIGHTAYLALPAGCAPRSSPQRRALYGAACMTATGCTACRPLTHKRALNTHSKLRRAAGVCALCMARMHGVRRFHPEHA